MAQFMNMAEFLQSVEGLVGGGPGNGGLAARPAFLYILSFTFYPRDGSGAPPGGAEGPVRGGVDSSLCLHLGS